jgi:tRNA A-37 threonylcarbamoyl transferase component Bud32
MASMGEAGARRTRTQGQSGLHSFITRLGQVTRSARRTPSGWLTLAAVLLLLVGLGLDAMLHARMRARLSDRLQLLHRSNVGALRHWATDQATSTTALVELPDLRSALREVVAPGLTPEQRLAAARPVADQLTPVIRTLGRRGWMALDREGSGVAQQTQLVPITLPLHRLPGALEALEHGARVGAPCAIDDGLRQGGLEGEGAAMWVWVPIQAGSQRALGLFGLRLDVERDFASQLRSEASATSVESYAFDARGMLLSPSRFESQLQALGLVPRGQAAALRLVLSDPGGNLLEGFRSEGAREELPLTRAVRAATAGRDGLDLTGYRDYRGVPVVGAWSWLDELGIGVATEVDFDEAFELLMSLRHGLWVLWGLLALAACAAFFYSVRATQLVREVEAFAELGQYKLMEKLGEGGMGVVYRARHALLARPTAVKVLRASAADPELRARFEREVRITAELTHPNTIAIYDFGSSPEGTFYYAMEYIEGLDLETLVEQHGRQPYPRVLHILLQVAGSLGEAHARGFIHRDVKPANVMLGVRGGVADFVKVLDFGLVRTLGGSELKLTADDRVMGTPLYMAPEALTHPEALDARADLYALGAVGYFLLSGEDAFGGVSNPEVISRQLSGSFRRLDEQPELHLPAAIIDLIHRCMAFEPEQRPRSAEALRDEIEQLLSRYPWTRDDAAFWWSAYTPVPHDVDTSAVKRLSVALDRTRSAHVSRAGEAK